LACILGLVECMDRFVRTPVFQGSHLQPLTNRLVSILDSLEPNGVLLRSPRNRCLSNTVAFTVKGCDSISLLAGLDLEGICASSGSACSTGSIEPSHVIQALGEEPETAQSLVRFSLGRESTMEEVQVVEEVLPRIISRAQNAQ
jgi:cysteine desulfurase